MCEHKFEPKQSFQEQLKIAQQDLIEIKTLLSDFNSNISRIERLEVLIKEALYHIGWSTVQDTVLLRSACIEKAKEILFEALKPGKS